MNDAEQLAYDYFTLAAQHRKLAATLGEKSPRAAEHAHEAIRLDEIGMGWIATRNRLEHHCRLNMGKAATRL
jgi:hypothetical protein